MNKRPTSRLFDHSNVALEGDTHTVSGQKGDQIITPSLSPVVLKKHPSLLAYPRAVCLALALLILGAFMSHYRDHWWMVCSILAGLILLFILIERSFRHYIVSEKRIEYLWGIVARNSKEVRIEDIRAINVKKPGLRGLLGVGTVEFATAGSEEVEVAFRDVFGAERVKRIVRSLQDQAAS